MWKDEVAPKTFNISFPKFSAVREYDLVLFVDMPAETATFQQMSAQQTVLRAFVASPSDVAEERSVVEDVVREFNITWSQNFA